MPTEQHNTETLSRSARKKALMRRKLIEGARRVMGEKGVEATTIKDITEAADVGFGSFYSYFDSKEEIMREAAQEVLHGFSEALDAYTVTLDDPVDVMATAFGNFLLVARTDPVLCWFLVRAGDVDPELSRDNLRRMQRDLERGVAAGTFHIENMEATIALTAGAVFGYFRQRLLGVVDESADVHAIESLLRLIGTEGSAAKRAAENFARLAIGD